MRVLRVGPDRLLAAAERLVGSGNGPGTVAARRFLESARALRIDLSHIWGVDEAGGKGFSQVCLAVPGSGRTAMLFLSANEDHTPNRRAHGPRASESPVSQLDQRVGLLRAACEELAVLKPPGPHSHAGRAVCLAQALLEPSEIGAVEALAGAGFVRLGDLAYMRRSLRKESPEGGAAWPEGVEVKRLSEFAQEDRTGLLVRALERSYIATLDCPELCGMRRVSDVLDSHFSVGAFNPDLWWVVLAGGEPEGCMLLSACPEQQVIELVYLGLSPALRGRGIGRSLLRMGFAEIKGRPERSMTCAVDVRNHPALRLYQGAGFQQFSTRIPMVKPLGQPLRGPELSTG